MNCTCLPTPDIGSVNANAIGDYSSFVAESVNRLSYSGTVLTDSNIDCKRGYLPSAIATHITFERIKPYILPDLKQST